MKTVGDITRKYKPSWIASDLTVREGARHMCERQIGAAAVMDGRELVGVFSERDVLRLVVNEGRDPDRTLVGDVMSTRINCIHLDDSAHMAKALMHTQHVRHLIVVDSDNQYCGMISMRDLVEGDLEQYESLVHDLNDMYYEQKYRDKWRISSNRVIVESYSKDTPPTSHARMEIAGNRATNKP
jgi:CBS domain-containing protein